LDRSLNLLLQEGTYVYGKAFEHFVIIEIIRYSAYAQNDWQFYYLRTKDNAEIDFVIERPGMPVALIEIESTDVATKRDVFTLNRFSRDISPSEVFCVSRDPYEKKIGSVWYIPWHRAFDRIGLE
jgi:predicted AAA+ superfamily ATPase